MFLRTVRLELIEESVSSFIISSCFLDWYEKYLFICNSALANDKHPSLPAAGCHALNVGAKVRRP